MTRRRWSTQCGPNCYRLPMTLLRSCSSGLPEKSMQQWPTREEGVQIRANSAENWLEDVLPTGRLRIVNPPGSEAVKDEWKECRATIGRFDGLLVDLRKTGFGFVTAIGSGATFFFAYDPTKPMVPESGKFAVFTIIMVLTLTLYIIDRVHQLLMQQAVNHARSLEAKIGFSISSVLGSKYTKKYASKVGVALYLILLGALYMASLFSSDAWRVGLCQAWWPSVYQPLMLLEFVLGILIIEIVVRMTRL